MKKFERFIIYPLLIVALFYIISGQQAIVSAENILDKLVVREIFVVNDSGQEVVNICANSEGGGSVWTFNENGVKGTSMGSVSDGGVISTSNRNGVIGTCITSDDFGGFIWTSDKDGAMRTAMFSDNEASFIQTLNKEGVVGSSMTTSSLDDSSIIRTYNKNGFLGCMMSSSDYGNGIGTFSFYKDGVPGSMLGSTDAGNGLVIFNQKGGSLVDITSGETGHGLINLYDKYGEECTSYSYKP